MACAPNNKQRASESAEGPERDGDDSGDDSGDGGGPSGARRVRAEGVGGRRHDRGSAEALSDSRAHARQRRGSETSHLELDSARVGRDVPAVVVVVVVVGEARIPEGRRRVI